MLRDVEIQRLIDLQLTGNEIKVYLFGLLADKFTTDIASKTLGLNKITVNRCYKNLTKYGLMEITRKHNGVCVAVEYKFF